MCSYQLVHCSSKKQPLSQLLSLGWYAASRDVFEKFRHRLVWAVAALVTLQRPHRETRLRLLLVPTETPVVVANVYVIIVGIKKSAQLSNDVVDVSKEIGGETVPVFTMLHPVAAKVLADDVKVSCDPKAPREIRETFATTPRRRRRRRPPLCLPRPSVSISLAAAARPAVPFAPIATRARASARTVPLERDVARQDQEVPRPFGCRPASPRARRRRISPPLPSGEEAMSTKPRFRAATTTKPPDPMFFYRRSTSSSRLRRASSSSTFSNAETTPPPPPPPTCSFMAAPAPESFPATDFASFFSEGEETPPDKQDFPNLPPPPPALGLAEEGEPAAAPIINANAFFPPAAAPKPPPPPPPPPTPPPPPPPPPPFLLLLLSFLISGGSGFVVATVRKFS